MRRLRFKPDGPYENFGDALNKYLWPALLPNLEAREGVFVGIGTLLDCNMVADRPMIVFGAGCGYNPPPDLSGADIRFVRGPRTAKVLGLPESKAITDPAILLHDWLTPDPTYDWAFMPRWTGILHDPTIPERLAAHSIHTIDPTWPVDKVLLDISRTKLLITEALHGAVVADAFRIPWIPVYSEQGHLFKWLDWCASMDLPYDPVDMHVCSVLWARDNAARYLSGLTFNYRLRQVNAQVEKLRAEG